MFSYIEIFGKTISTYAIMAILGALAAGFYACLAARRRLPDYIDTLILLLVSSVGVFIGGHILYGITQYRVLFAVISDPGHITSFNEFIDIFNYIFGGSVFYGGLLGGIITGTIYIKRKKLDFYTQCDIVAPSIALFHFFGRIGCFLGGCCYGIECSFGVIFTSSPIISANGVCRFPVQLLEAAFELILFIVLAILYYKNILKGRLILLYLITYSSGRFVFEFLRADNIRGFIFGISTSQAISIVIFFVSLIAFIIIKKNKERYE